MNSNTMYNTPFESIDSVIESQRVFFKSGMTRNVKFRIDMLKRLKSALLKWEKPLMEALWKDLHKSYEEAYMTENSIVLGEIENHLRHLRRWTRMERVHTPLKMFPSRTGIVYEPLGCTLIVAPWNYPVQLLLNPLVGAISAGCTALLKPSPYVPSVSEVTEKMINDAFDSNYVAVVQGNRDVNAYLFSKKYDMVFFTGSPALGRIVIQSVAPNLTPVILELGGKSPCIVDRTADVGKAARRIAWGKTLNSGQTCIAPDYLILHNSIKAQFVNEFAKAVRQLHGDDILESSHYVRMVSDKAFDRVAGYMNEGKVIYGGRSVRSERFIEPTLMEDCPPDSSVMMQEIFGPVFPIVTFDDKDGSSFIQQAADYVNEREKPLALYWFGKERDGMEMISRTSSGGACINDTIMHIANENAPFGGVGNSGMGKYHGRLSFLAFSNSRTVVRTGTLFDLPLRYMPYRMFGIIKKLL